MLQPQRLIFSPERLDRVLWVGHLLLLPAIAWGIAAVYAPMNVGMVTSVVTFFLAAMCVCFREYRTRRGLWMLALVFGVPFVLVYVVFVYESLRPWSTSVLDLVDFLVATGVLGVVVRILASVYVHNRSLKGEEGLRAESRSERSGI